MAEGVTTLELLGQKRIHVDANIPPHQFLFRWDGTPCFSRGELVAVTGKAKSGKTYLCSILMALTQQQQLLCLHREEDRTLRVLWIDTEQSEDSTQEILRDRVGRLISSNSTVQNPSEDSVSDWEDNFEVYNLRSVSWRGRMELVTAAIVQSGADLVIFDGIRDVVGDINDYTEAQQTVEKMLSLASWSKACIVCVLHQNKSAEDKTLRGALGTELQNKSFETYECSKNPDTKVFSISQVATRKYDVIGKMEFSVDATGLPKSCIGSLPSLTPAETRTEPKTRLNPEFLNEQGRLDKKKLMRYIFRDETHRRRGQLVTIVMKVAWVKSYSNANNIVEECVANQILKVIKVGDSEFFQLQYPELELGGNM